MTEMLQLALIGFLKSFRIWPVFLQKDERETNLFQHFLVEKVISKTMATCHEWGMEKRAAFYCKPTVGIR